MQELMIVQAGVSLAVTTALVVYVALLRPKGAAHWALLGVLASIVAWDLGAAIAWSTAWEPSIMDFAVRLVFLGACFVPAFFLLLAAHCTRTPTLEERPAAVTAAVLAPSFALYGLFLTNPLHGLFARSLGAEVFTAVPSEWAGPFFWVHTVWAYLYIAAGLWLCLRAAAASRDRFQRSQLLLLSAGAGVPVVANAVHIFDLSPIRVSLTYGALGMTGFLLVIAIARYRFLEFPLAARDVIAHLKDALLVADPSGKVTEANAGAEQVLGARLQELRGRDLGAIADGLEPSGVLSRDLAAASNGGFVARSVETSDGRSLDVTASWLRAADGEPLGRLLVLGDRTEQRRYERLRQRTQRLESLGSLVAGISHEINNPLSYVRSNLAHILGIARLIDDQLDELPEKAAAQLRELCEVAQESVEGLDRIKEIVTSTRRLARDPTPTRERIDVNAVVTRSIRFASLDENQNVSLEADLGRHLPRIEGSADRLGQVLLNLLLNARQILACRGGGTIRVETRECRCCQRCQGGVEIRVHDDGPGIAPEQRERIFEPFFTTRGDDGGTGLGLTISFDIVREHGGTIEIGRSPMGGACFTVRLPREQPVATVAD